MLVSFRTENGRYLQAENGGGGGVMLVSFRTENGRYLQAENGGGGALRATGPWAREWETFDLTDVHGGGLIVGDAIHLRTQNGHYVQAGGGGGREVNASCPWAREWETFTIVRADRQGGALADGMKVALRAGNGQWVCAEGGGGGAVNANRNAVAGWETFSIEIKADPATATRMKVCLQTHTGHYVQAVNGGGSAVVATPKWSRQWETLDLVDVDGGAIESGNRVHIISPNGGYFQARNGGGSAINAQGPHGLEWETFRIHNVGSVGPIASGAKVALQAFNGQYVCAEGGGGGAMNANRGAVGAWETFSLRRVDLPAVEVRTSFNSMQHGFHFGNRFVNEVFAPLQIKTFGRCGGMAYASLDFFFAGRPIPNRGDLPPDNDPLAQYIYARLLESFAKPSSFAFLSWTWNSDEQVSQWTRRDEFMGKIRPALDSGRPVIIGLPGSENVFQLGAKDHQVVAYGYCVEHNGDIKLFIYDNNAPEQEVTLTAAAGTTEVAATFGGPWRGFFLQDYNHLPPPLGL